MITIKNQNFGVEIELTGITRSEAAEVIAEYYGTEKSFEGTFYQTWTAKDSKGRKWKAMFDSSITAFRKINGRKVRATDEYKCEIVTPILQYDDIEDLQNIIRKLREKGAITNSSCGIHIHIDGANHNYRSLTRLITFIHKRQDLIYEAVDVQPNRVGYCKKLSKSLYMEAKKTTDTHSLRSVWYSEANDNYRDGISHSHYNSTRYHGINLHAFFTKGTVEFRLFNSTTHAGKIKAYIQFCLAMSTWAVEGNEKNLYFKSCAHYTKQQKGVLMMNMLTNRLGLTGKEFKTARYHLTSEFKANETALAS